MKRFSISCCLLALTATTAMGQSEGHSSAQQNFRVVVPTSATVSVPTLESGATKLVHDETDQKQSFRPLTWTVKGNTLAGVAVSFETSTPFVNVDQPTFRRDVGLHLAVVATAGSASWQVTQETSESSYESGQQAAAVMAESNGVGRADLALTVDFITDSFGTLATGDYVTTVVGTVSPQ